MSFHPHLVPVPEQAQLPGTQPTQAELMDRLLLAIAEHDRFRAYDVVDQMICPDDLPTRQELYKTRLELMQS